MRVPPSRTASAFTLVELLTVMAIILILAVATLPALARRIQQLVRAPARPY